MWAIDGSQKSGSGTIVRTAVALSALLGEPLCINNIRAKRDNPGLRPQHLKAVEAVAALTQAKTEGARVGSREISFLPGKKPSGGEFFWDIGTAGSTTMLALTVLPVAVFAKKPSVFRIRGGLFQDFAPSAFHTQEVLLPALRAMGIRAELRIIRPGYVPKGGGEIELQVEPINGPLSPLRREALHAPLRFWGISLASHLKERKVAERMAARCKEELAKQGISAEFRILNDETSIQPGAALALFAGDQKGTRLGADQAGAPGRPAEKIAEFVAQSLLEDLESGATVDRHLADQLILYAALASGETVYVIPSFTDHVEANLWLVETLLGAKWELQGKTLWIKGIGYARG
ncbi:RNA 3'-phosphate cyclase [Candidatus Bipolaricaulota bacterium]|nr:RNA 3'-phosphate cyclase [Candidatus Bipolaricaulota bacterium]